MNEMFYFFVFFNALDPNNQKILCPPSIYEFERTGTNLNHPKVATGNWTRDKAHCSTLEWQAPFTFTPYGFLMNSISFRVFQELHFLMKTYFLLAILFLHLDQNHRNFCPNMSVSCFSMNVRNCWPNQDGEGRR